MCVFLIDRRKTSQMFATLKKVAKELHKSEVPTSLIIVPSHCRTNIETVDADACWLQNWLNFSSMLNYASTMMKMTF